MENDRPTSIPVLSLLSPDGKLVAGYAPSIPADQLIKGYQTMLITRMVDERMVTLQRQGEITFAMSSKGEEACAVASAHALSLDDWMYPQYREAGILFWRGFSIQDYIHHMFGNSKDLSRGRQMPNHFGSKALNIVTVSSPIGTKIPHAAGCAYGMLLGGEKACAICYFGEGATSEGDFHVGLRFAAVKKAPALFFCRNNGWAISTPACKQFATDNLAMEGIGHGIATYRVDGNDYFAIYEVVRQAKERAINGLGPAFIEAMTYRLGAHSTSDDPSRYRSDDEVAACELKCPLLRLKNYLTANGLWDEGKEASFVQKVKEEIDKAIEEAKKTPKPPLSSLVEDVYFEVPLTLQEQYRKLLIDCGKEAP